MKRQFTIPAIAAFALVAAVVHADVKTKEKTQTKFGGGMLGALMNRAAGDAAKDGIINTVAVKGNRKSSINDSTGQIIDLSEEKIYDLDVKKKEYKVTTFAEMRQRIKDAEEKAAKQAKDAPPEDKDLAGGGQADRIRVRREGDRPDEADCRLQREGSDPDGHDARERQEAGRQRRHGHEE